MYEKPDAMRFDTPDGYLPDEPRKRHIGWWIAAVVLIALIGLGFYGYPMLKEHNMLVSHFPAIQAALSTAGDQVKQLEQKITGLSEDQRDLGDRVAELQKRMEAGLRSAHELAVDVRRRVNADTEQQLGPMRQRMAELESQREADRVHVASLETQLRQVRQTVNQQAAELDGVRHDVAVNGASRDRQLASLYDTAFRNQRGLDALSHRGETERVPFEATRNHRSQLTPDISLDITSTDIRHRAADGYMWVTPDRRAFWLHNLGAQQPLVFYGYKDGLRRELVITDVTRDSVAGYLILPAGTSTLAEPARSVAGLN